MGKVAKVKSKSSSANSRAARRATSPSIDLDKSVKNMERPLPDMSYNVLAAKPGANISKKAKQKTLTRQQRLRKERGMARADIVLDQLQQKVGKSKAKSRVIKDRRTPWEELNNDVEVQKPPRTPKIQKPKTGSEALAEQIIDEALPLEDADAQHLSPDEHIEELDEELMPDPAAALVNWGDGTDGIE